MTKNEKAAAKREADQIHALALKAKLAACTDAEIADKVLQFVVSPKSNKTRRAIFAEAKSRGILDSAVEAAEAWFASQYKGLSF